jgi:hypothetical protein
MYFLLIKALPCLINQYKTVTARVIKYTEYSTILCIGFVKLCFVEGLFYNHTELYKAGRCFDGRENRAGCMLVF